MSFAAAAFLGGLVLLGVPWWLHRLSAHAADQRTFSSLFLMRHSKAPVQMRRKLQHLWLMGLRMLLLALACLAFAQPMLQTSGVTVPLASADRIIVLDTSLSMRRATNGSTAFEEARQIARDLVARRPGQRSALVTVAGQMQLETPLTDDTGLLNAAIAASAAGSDRLLLDGLLGRLASLTGSLAAPGERLEVHLISDFQATSFPDQFNALVDGAVWPVTLHSVHRNAANWAVMGMVHRDAPATAAANASRYVEVSVRGFATPARTVDVILQQNETQAGRQSVAVPADGSASVLFELPPAKRGHTTWLARVEGDDALHLDDTRYLVRSVSESTVLPIIANDAKPFAYLRAAVEAAVPRFLPERRSNGDGLSGEVPVAILADPGTLDAATEAALKRFVESGGSAFVTAGAATRTAGRIALVDLALAPSRFDQSRRGIVAADRSHPVLEGFDTWQDLAVFQAVKASESGSRLASGEVILMLDDGTPLLIEFPLGAGRLLVLMTGLDPEWTSLVVRPAFVDLIDNVLGYLAEDLLPEQAVVAQPFTIPAHSVQLFDAAGTRVLGLSNTVGRPTVRIAEPGIYQLRTPNRTRPLAVNTAILESDLRRAPDALLSRWQAATSRASGVSEVTEPTAQQRFASQIQPLGPWLLVLLLVLTLAEPLFANSGLWFKLRREPVTV